ncbi:MAG: hypothetical protein Q9227_006320 [Pyrenula ochraceoflavens]
MAAAAAGIVMGIIGLAMGGIGMVPLSKSFAPDKSDQTTTVRIAVGTSLDDSANTHGNTPGIALFDVVGRKIGSVGGSSSVIADGSFSDIKVVAGDDMGGRQAEYVSISNGGNDALCIAYISMTWPDGSQYIWSGDVGYSCGGHWYPSQTTFGQAGKDYKPRCLWIDGDDSNGITTQGLGMHITDFESTNERAAAYNKNNRLMCGSMPRFWLYNTINSDKSLPYFDPPLEYDPGTLLDMDESKVWVAGSNRDPKNAPVTRRVKERAASDVNNTTIGTPANSPMAGRLITSNDTLTSAVELCESETSRGPDHLSFFERKFCDMTTKQLYGFCEATNFNGTACFDTAMYTLRTNARSLKYHRRRASNDPSPGDKTYRKITHWR